jgi:hypothetical protein
VGFHCVHGVFYGEGKKDSKRLGNTQAKPLEESAR